MSDYASKVAAGIKFLDENTGKPCTCSQGADCSLSTKGKVPADWRKKIDTSTLNLDSSSKCVVGQIFGEYFKGLAKLGVSENKYVSEGQKSAYEFGFIADGPSHSLTEEWKRALAPSQPVKATLVSLGKVYVDGTYAAKVVDYVWLDVKNVNTKVYVVQLGKARNGKFEPYSEEISNLLLKSKEEILVDYPKMMEEFKIKDGMFVTNTSGKSWFIKGDYAYPLTPGDEKVEYRLLLGLRELKLSDGRSFSTIAGTL